MAAYLRLQGITVFPYLDDWLLVASAETLSQQVDFTLSFLSNLGLQVNHEKSILTPTQVITYIGGILDAVSGCTFIPESRILKIHHLLPHFTPGTRIQALLVQRLLGLMASTTVAVQHARLKMRALQSWYEDLFDLLIDPPSNLLTVTQELVEQLAWWSLCSNLLVGHPFGPLQPSIQLTTDASLSGWGAHCLNLTANGHWIPQEAALHINALELLAVFKAALEQNSTSAVR